MTMTATQGQSTKAARQGRSDCWTDDAATFWRVNSLLPYKHVGGFGFGAIEVGAPEFHCTYILHTKLQSQRPLWKML